MGRNRVLSFMSQFSASHRDLQTPASTSPSPPADSQRASPNHKPDGPLHPPPQHHPAASNGSPVTPVPSSPVRAEHDHSPSINYSHSASPAGRQRSSSRPSSMIQTYQPPIMDVNEDTIPELQPIFTFLNSHQNKLYQEGYFLKLDDQDSRGRPNPDRTWTECFAQLVGTILSLWDAAELDAAGEDGEVLPKFINLTDASIKMIESLPTKSNDEQPLQNILSISTAGRNRYLLHFNSHHSLIQWTAGIRLAMFEHSTLQEAYTGALIAGKGKSLNNINIIMDRTKFKVEEWVRVRFGAGVPWRRCWCVISPPDEKEYQKLQKEMKKRSPYDRSHAPVLKGDIKFYDSKKEADRKKKARPIASITDAYSAYAIYPQSRALIDGSTLLKVEGHITIHSEPPSATEGFVFIMPEVPPAVSGFEMLLRFLFPSWDTFGLYGRPGRLVASVLDTRSLMFAMPKHKRYGYLEILDVTGLILEDGSSTWSEREWRKRLKELTSQRMTAVEDGVKTHGRSGSRSSKRMSFGPQPSAPSRPRVNFADDNASIRSSQSMSLTQPVPTTSSAPPDHERGHPPSAMARNAHHSRNISDSQVANVMADHQAGHAQGMPAPLLVPDRTKPLASDLAATPERVSSEEETTPPPRDTPPHDVEAWQRMTTPEPVNAPPAFAHGAGSRPIQQPYHSPELRRANSRLSSSTLSQLAKAGGLVPDRSPDDLRGRYAHGESPGSIPGHADPSGPSVQPQANAITLGTSANYNGSREALISPPTNTSSTRGSPGLEAPPHHMALGQKRSRSPLAGPPTGPPPHNVAAPFLNSRDRSPAGQPPRGPPSGARAPSPMPGPHESPQGPPRIPPPRDPDNYHYPSPFLDSQVSQNYQAQSPPPPPTSERRTPPPNPAVQPPLRISTSPPVRRKPLPQNRAEKPAVPPSPSSTTSFSSRVLDDEALALVRAANVDDPSGPFADQGLMRHGTNLTGDSSHYGDTASTASPDYASTRKSTDTQESVERPRAGVLRTVGEPLTEPPPVPKHSGYDIPEINFGPTPAIAYRGPHAARTKTPSPLPSHPSPRPSSPAASGRKSPGPAAGYSHFRQDSDDTIRRSVAWQPGGVRVGSPSAERAMSPEEFVQQRAAAATTPLYSHSHQRQPSGNTLAGLRTGTPTPPLRRRASQELLTAMSNSRPGSAAHSRNNSSDLLQRPSSRGTAVVLSSGELSSHLSAREQEHVARVTGNPLLDVATNRPVPHPQGGLVGAIEARELQKAQMKQGLGGQAVAQAIDQRQREQQSQAQRAAQAAYVQHQTQLAAQQQQQQQDQRRNSGFINLGPSPVAYDAGFGGMSMDYVPGPAMMNPGMIPQQQRQQMMPQQGVFNPGPPPNWMPQGAQGGHTQGAGWSMPNMQHRPGPHQPMYGQPSGMQGPSMGMGMGMNMQGGRPLSPAFHRPNPGQVPPPGSPGGPRPGTPGQMQFQGQAF